MLNVLLAVNPECAKAVALLPLTRALVDRGHRVVFLAGAPYRARIERAGAVFVDAGPDIEEARLPARGFLARMRQADAVIRRQYLGRMPHQWAMVQRVVRQYAIDVVLADPMYHGAVALAQLPRAERPALVALGSSPLRLPDPMVAPYGFGLRPNGNPAERVRNAALHALISRVLLRGLVHDLHADLTRLTGQEVRGGAFDLLQGVDAWAQLTVGRFEYPRAREIPDLVYVGPLRPEERGDLPDWWDYADRRPVVCVRYEPNVPLENLVVPALLGLQDEDVLVVVTGASKDEVERVLGRPVPGNARIEPTVPYAHLLSAAKAVVKAGDYVQTQYALRWGVPLVVSGTLPEQVETNARVEWTGVGVDLRAERPTPAQMQQAVLRVLRDPGMRRSAARIAAQIATSDAERTLVDLAEHVVTGRGRTFTPADPDRGATEQRSVAPPAAVPAPPGGRLPAR